ncbi:MAG: hypothetical protein Q4G09_06255 [Clostridia bacterium]|nr:hypothetical protein [Clostridia bacterium]
MKNIYILLTYTGTVLSGIIKYYTKEKYSHVSIGLDSDLKELYSFGRLNPYNPYKGGFVHEELNKGTYKRFKNTIGAVYSLSITEEEYNNVVNMIKQIKQNKEKYKFNVLGLFFVALHKKYKRENAFYCAEFVKYILETSLNKKLLPEIIKPTDFLELENIELVYEGLLKKYTYKQNNNLQFNEFYKKNVTA